MIDTLGTPDTTVRRNAKPQCDKGPCSGDCKRSTAESALPPPVQDDVEAQFPIKISNDFAADILSPYRRNAVYLKSAEITQFSEKASIVAGSEDQRLVTGRGRFTIPESCYIDDTGHFNAVEFNICYNQLAYVLFAKCIEARLMHRLRNHDFDVMSLVEFKKRQLPAMVIVSLESRYYNLLNSMDFTAELTINKMTPVGSAWFFFTSITFADHEGIKAKGSVVLAYSPTFAPVRH
ncbi:MAG TPA: FcoT family thioesterase [Pirellulales bacterium]|jgi:hypothetical protein|nr:FcoT family thioesterase [Pirellulales bacterium]